MEVLCKIIAGTQCRALVVACCLLLSGCGFQAPHGPPTEPPGSTSKLGSVPSGARFVAPGAVPIKPATAEQELLAAQTDHARKREITVGATVIKKLRDDREGLPHERFLIGLDNGSTVLVAHDIQFAPYVPLHDGDFVMIHGEYIWNPKGGVIHWTHHSDTPRHEGGWIELNGQKYQ